MLVLDSSAVSALARQTRRAAARILVLRESGLWPPLVPSIVLVECLQGHAGRDATTNRFLKTCDIVESLEEPLARRAALLRNRARRGSAVDVVTVVMAEPDGTVLTSNVDDLEALAQHARGVAVERI
jgi:predicted nucleic acid-binding protein